MFVTSHSVTSLGTRCRCSHANCRRNKLWKVYSTSLLIQRKRSQLVGTALTLVLMQQGQHHQQEEQPRENGDSNWKVDEASASTPMNSIEVKPEKDWHSVAKETEQQAEEKLLAAKTAERQAQEAEEHEALHAPSSGKERAAALRIEAEQLRLQAERARLEAEKAQLEAEKIRFALEKEKWEKTKQQSTKEVVTPHNDLSSNDSNDSVIATPSPPPVAPGSGYFVGPMNPFAKLNIPRIAENDVKVLRESVFGFDTFYVTHLDRSPLGDRVIFHGNLRTDSAKAVRLLNEALEKKGLAPRVRLFLMEDPLDNYRPVFIALPKQNEALMVNRTFEGIASVFLGVLGTITTLGYGVGVFGLTPVFLDKLKAGNTDEVYQTLPISLGAIAIVLLHEMGHRIVASMKNIKLGLPLTVPSLQIGSYGTITPLKDFPKNRSDFFDVTVAGPLVGVVTSVTLFVVGLTLSQQSLDSQTIPDWFPQVPSLLFRASMLVGSLAKIIAPYLDLSHNTVAVHPLTVVGYTGLLINALNLLPIGRLDGGRIVQCIFGRSTASRVGGITLLLQGLGAVLGNSPLLLFWGIFVVLFQREMDLPCEDELTEPNNKRSALGLVLLFVMLFTLIPFPDALGNLTGQY
ncbi:Probable zinc metalloprotease EGY1, chloroplastic [Galdieria sulphuraria]|uniref:Peptidase, M50 family protein n=1 Tax=Galdieria sulphuraria TaxID=130081 RepID=M2WYG4_GALSU|nr:peptidase, M50 family protein [Galdieria sulphuraria]EME29100.1 peptidase, M50 family protein [Galdieria sulphuraria]GJD12697.1 Probable zinc metalloprotease EGY1, chloroplastic [Galdieria sulphuraria]|eukprot:XP_005705620.1 peptidase, M50 family protein [Galdieria sulphuraria]